MRNEPQAGTVAPTYVINRGQGTDTYSVWQFDPKSSALFSQVSISPNASFPSNQNLCAIGGYLMSYSSLNASADSNVDYSVFEFDSSQPDPLNVKAVQKNYWDQSKFSGYYDHYTWEKDTETLQLIPMTGYVLAYIPSSARATYRLWNFDPVPNAPGKADPLPNAITPMDAFSLIGEGSELLPIGNYVLEWIPAKSQYRVWSFDPQEMTPLSLPTIAEGTWPDIDSSHRLLVIGEYLLDWVPSTREYTLWWFDPMQTANPLVGPMQNGVLPEGFDAGSMLTTVQNTVPVSKENANTPGTMDFMRDKIEHVVVYMLESRSMDSVLGWLHENNPSNLNFVNAEPPFKGTSTSYSNKANGETFNVYKFEDGKLSTEYDLTAPAMDPFHGTPDSIHQQYAEGYAGYFSGATPDMSGFVKNNCRGDVMVTLDPAQLPVLNGIAGSYSVSDYWFSGLPGGTDSNRAIALTGSAFNITTTYEGNPQYEYFPEQARRQSIWKVLWNNGITDWKIYWSVEWYDYVFTYQLYLKGDIPTVDANVADGKTDYIAPIDQFMTDAAAGTLPKFSFLEPFWIAPSGATSYHPGGDLVPAEKALNSIYEAVANGPGWEKTALVITFSKGGGLYDHEAPPETVNPWPKDANDGFTYNVLGPRVPAIVVSPWVNENTVFRSPSATPLSATSLPATLLEWFGVPKARWGLGDRVPASATFEEVFQRNAPRTDKPTFTPPYDKSFPLPVSSAWASEPTTGEWNTASNWADNTLPTDTASFAASSQTSISFSSSSDVLVNQIEFGADAPSYDFIFGPTTTPALTLTGKGVINASSNDQKFTVEATSTGPYDPQLKFSQSASAGGSNVKYAVGPISLQGGYGGGVISFGENSTAGSAMFTVRTGALRPPEGHTVGGEVSFTDSASAGTALFTTYGTLGADGDTFGNVVFHKNATAANGTFICIGGTVAYGDGGNTQLYDTSTADYGLFKNYGATCEHGNGGDVAFDGNATGGFGRFYNYAAEAAGGYGGVTSFNNNPPVMAQQGTSAGNASIFNYGARGGSQGGGGHLSFSAKYGSPTAASATVTNYGSDISGKSSAGHTIFSINLPTDYYPTAGSAVIHNKSAEGKNGAAGYTEFSVYAAEKGGSTVLTNGNIPTAGNAVIVNYGGDATGVSGGYTEFVGTTTASNAQLIAHGGHNEGYGGTISFYDTSRAGNARLTAEGGYKGGEGGRIVFGGQSIGDTAQVQLSGNSELDIHSHTGALTIATFDVNEGSIVTTLGAQVPSLTLSVELILKSKTLTFYFEQKSSSGFVFNTPYTVLSSPNLSSYKENCFEGNTIDGVKPTFSIVGNELQVSYKKE